MGHRIDRVAVQLPSKEHPMKLQAWADRAIDQIVSILTMGKVA
jgi:hypothetical protein